MAELAREREREFTLHTEYAVSTTLHTMSVDYLFLAGPIPPPQIAHYSSVLQRFILGEHHVEASGETHISSTSTRALAPSAPPPPSPTPVHRIDSSARCRRGGSCSPSPLPPSTPPPPPRAVPIRTGTLENPPSKRCSRREQDPLSLSPRTSPPAPTTIITTATTTTTTTTGFP